MSSVFKPSFEKVLKLLELKFVDFLDIFSQHRIRFDVLYGLDVVTIVSDKLRPNSVVKSLLL
jgi:hypothetical protein